MADCGAGEIVGIDADRNVLDLARAGQERPTVSFLLADAREVLPFPDDSFDVAHLADFYDLTPLPELRRIVRPGGRIVVRATGVVYSHDQALVSGSDLHRNRGWSTVSDTRARML